MIQFPMVHVVIAVNPLIVTSWLCLLYSLVLVFLIPGGQVFVGVESQGQHPGQERVVGGGVGARDGPFGGLASPCRLWGEKRG